MKFGLNEEIIINLCEYFSAVSNINKVVIFGSRARGDYRQGSDIDIAIYTVGRMKRVVRDVVEAIVGLYKVDIVEMETLENEQLIKNIEKDGVVIFER